MEGYTSGFNVNFDIEDGPTNVPGGSLFLHETVDTMYFGLILPLNIIDNTYGDYWSLLKIEPPNLHDLGP